MSDQTENTENHADIGYSQAGAGLKVLYLKRVKSKGHEYLYLAEDVMVDGRLKTKTIENFGRVDRLLPGRLEEILASYPNSRTYLTAQIEETIKRILPLIQKDKPMELQVGSVKVGQRGLLLNYGHFIVKHVWDKYLKLPRPINALQRRSCPKMTCKVNTIAWFLAASKMMEPSSYFDLFGRVDTFVANPIANTSIRQLYAALSYIGQFKDQIMKCAYDHIGDKFGFGKPKLLFFDCTNFYFESPYDSKEEFIMKHHQRRANELEAEGHSYASASDYLKSSQYASELKSAVDAAGRAGRFTRMRGPSKEGRFAQPLMGLALVIDEHGFPLDFELYPGNNSEFGYLKRAVLSIKHKYGITDAFFVADRGLNSSQNLEFIQSIGMGFIVAQKITQQKPEQRREMLSEKGWKSLDLTKDPWAAHLMVDDVDGAAYRYKVCDYTKISYEKLETNGNGPTKRRQIKVKCKIIYTYSEKRKRRDNCVIDALEAKAQDAINQHKHAENPNKTGWKGMLLTQADVENGADNKDKSLYVALDQEKIQEMRALAGYAAMVFDVPQNNEMTPAEAEVAAQCGYKQLVSIEDCFRIAKSTLRLRPVYLKRDDHTLGHCVLCVLGMTMLKIVQYELQQRFGVVMSIRKIQKALNQAKVYSFPSSPNLGKALFLSCDEAKDGQIKGKNGESEAPSNLDYVLAAVGMSPLSLIETDGSLRMRLKIAPQESVLTDWQRGQMAKLTKSVYAAD